MHNILHHHVVAVAAIVGLSIAASFVVAHSTRTTNTLSIQTNTIYTPVFAPINNRVSSIYAQKPIVHPEAK